MALCNQCGKEFAVGKRKYQVEWQGWRKKLFCSYECRAEWVERSREATKFLEDLVRKP
jgi:hypothetical protein